jgi:4-hydroxythreonine-4-phosphate dehydrogenase
MLPRIAVTSGEPAGIGPELCLRLAPHEGPVLHPVILGDRSLLAARAEALGIACRLSAILTRKILLTVSSLDVLHLPLAAPVRRPPA